MIKETLHFLREQTDWQPEAGLLLAVSGGIDSMVMAHLFLQAKEEGLIHGKLALAHCHFGLREEADEDAAFVRHFAEEAGLACYEKRFATAEFAERQQISIQMAARELRYLWFEQLLEKEQFDYLLTAHHLNDALETALLNFTRGTGIKGLSGIPPQRNHILRPLLWASRKQIETYANNKKIKWREDLSNLSRKYRRNLIRQDVIPKLEAINPSLSQGFRQMSGQLREAEALYRYAVKKLRRAICRQEGKKLFINKEQLLKSPAPASLLYEFIKPFGFSPAISEQALHSVQMPSGGVYLSPSYEMLSDRKQWIIRPRHEIVKRQPIRIEKGQEEVHLPHGGKILMKWDIPPEYPFSDNPNQILIDAQRPDYPLLLRPWRPGDVMQPLGMKGRRKKLQDIFTDAKLNRFEKEEAWVLTSAQGRIIWAVGLRMAEWCKLTEHTKSAVLITYTQTCPSQGGGE